MSQVGIALNATFGSALAQTTHQQMASCGVLPLALPRPLTIADFDYIVCMSVCVSVCVCVCVCY